MTFQRFKSLAVAEEIGHTDEHVAEQGSRFAAVLLKIVQVTAQVGLPGDMQAALDPS